MIKMLDDFTIAHLDAWIEHELGNRLTYDDQLEIRCAMLRAATYDPDWLDRGWWKLYDHLKMALSANATKCA